MKRPDRATRAIWKILPSARTELAGNGKRFSLSLWERAGVRGPTVGATGTLTLTLHQREREYLLESSIKPLRHWIPAFVQDKAEEFAAGLFDSSLRIQNFIAPGLAGRDYHRDAVHA